MRVRVCGFIKLRVKMISFQGERGTDGSPTNLINQRLGIFLFFLLRLPLHARSHWPSDPPWCRVSYMNSP